jgi:hypothetical protein
LTVSSILTPSSAPDETRDRARRAVGGAQLVAVHDQRERDDRDHHRVPRPDLHERLPRAGHREPDGDDQLVRLQPVALRADEELAQRHRARAARRSELDLRAVDEQRRQRVSRGRGRAEVAADRAAVADLRPADSARGLGQREQRLGEPHRLGVGQPGAEPQGPVLAHVATQFGHLVQVQQRRRPCSVEVELDHHVGAALDRQRVGSLGLQRQRLLEPARSQDVHDGKSTSTQ